MNWFYAEAGKQAGPVTDEQLNELVRQGTINDSTLVWREGMAGWVPYGTIRPAPQTPPSVTTPEAAPLPFGQPLASHSPASGSAFYTEAEVLAREYKIDIGDSITQAWNIFTANIGLIIGTFIISSLMWAVGIVISFVASFVIPLGGVVVSLLYIMPLMAGLQWFLLRLVNKDDASVGDAFGGFHRNYVNLVLFGLAQILMILLCMMPLFIIAFVTGIVAAIKHGAQPPENLSVGVILALNAGSFLTMCILTYLSTLFIYVILLIVDKGYSFWPAIRLSAKMVSRRWWMTFLFLVVTSLIGVSGILICCVGLIMTIPLSWCMLVILYNDNFSSLAPREEK